MYPTTQVFGASILAAAAAARESSHFGVRRLCTCSQGFQGFGPAPSYEGSLFGVQHQIRFFEKFPARVFVFSLSAPAAGCEPAAKKYLTDKPEAAASSGVAKVTFAIQLRLADSAHPTNNSLRHFLLGSPVRLDFGLSLASAAAGDIEKRFRTPSHGHGFGLTLSDGEGLTA
jgi:hypothetical protein